MKKITMKEILALKPCLSSQPLQYAGKNWSGTVLDILKHPDVAPINKIWVVVRSPYLTKKQSVAFANFCANQAKQFSDDADAAAADADAAAADADAARAAAAVAAAYAYAADAAVAAAYAYAADAVRAAQVEKLIEILES
jgi:hypothetical protein